MVDNTLLIKPYLKKVKDRVAYVQVYLLPQEQLQELVCFLTGCDESNTKFPDRYRSETPFKLPSGKPNFHSVITKLCKFDQLDMLCLNCDESSVVTN